MKKHVLLVILALCYSFTMIAQVGINTDNSVPDSSAILDAKSITKGFLPPRMTTLQRNSIQSPATGLTVYNTDLNCLEFYAGSANGWYCPCPSTGTLNCNNTVVNGDYKKAIALTASNNIILSVTPTTKGGYSIVTETLNGITFSKMGTFTSLGSQTVVLNGTGSPIATGTFTYTVTYGTSTCDFTVTVSSGIPAQCLVAWYPFNGNANDESGNGHNGTVYGASLTIDRYGNQNRAYYFNGINNHIDIGSLNTQFFSHSFWYYKNSAGANLILSIQADIGKNFVYRDHGVGGGITFELGNGSGYTYLYTGVTTLASSWHHVVCTYDGAMMKVYLDAVLIGTKAESSYVFDNANTWLGQNPLSGSTMNGKMDDVRVYNCALTQSEITALYNEDATLPVVTTDAVSNITQTSAQSGGTVSSDGGTSVTARGICWSTSQNPVITDSHTSDGSGTGIFISSMSGLQSNTTYYVRAYATNSLGTAYGNQISFSTIPPFSCGNSNITVWHVAGSVAPLNKTVTYGTVTNIPGEPSKCWITSNLGADHQATAVDDATEASAGWYWQFNRKQGFKHDGTTRTPNTTWISPISENSEWLTANDPCNFELGAQWRIPTFTEWYNVDNTGGWNNWNVPWSSGLKLHAAGCLDYSGGWLGLRGSSGLFWSSQQESINASWLLEIHSNGSYTNTSLKSAGFSVRCIRDN